MKATLITLLLTATLAIGQTIKQDSLVIDGKTYKQVTIEKVSSGEARISHRDGIKRVLLQSLSKEFQDRLGFDSKELAKDQKEKQAILENQKLLNQSKLTYLYVDSVLSNGVIACYMIPISSGGGRLGSMGRIGGGGRSTPKKQTAKEIADYNRKYPFPPSMHKLDTRIFIPLDNLPKDKLFPETTKLKVMLVEDGSMLVNGHPMKKMKVVKLIAITH